MLTLISENVTRNTKHGTRLPFYVLRFTFPLALFLTACHPVPPADLTIINGNEPETLDPAIVTAVPDMRVAKALFEGLLRIDGQTGRPVPGWAESWVVSPDGKVYTFTLRSNATWSTGRPITTADVLYSWLRALDPVTASDYAGQLFYIRNAEDFYNGKIKDPARIGIHALDARSLQVELNSPIAFFLDLCCFPTLAIVPREAIEKYGDRWITTKPLPSSGPYELVAWRLNDKIRLGKNPRYWDAANTRSTTVDLLPTASANTALNLYETGVGDVIWDKDLVPVELMDVLSKRSDCHQFPYLGTYFYRFNVTRKPLNDSRVRRAFALATDRERIVKKLTSGGEKAAFHFVPNGVANYESPGGLSFNPEQARTLLAEAGFPGGKGFPRLQFMYYSGAGGAAQMQAKLAVELQQMWRNELGVTVELRQIERKIFYNAQSRLDYDLSASSWVGDYNDANTFLDMFTSQSGNNRTGWKSARYDELVRDANDFTDLKQRERVLRQAEGLLVTEDVPIVPVYFYAGCIFYRENEIRGISPNVLDEHPLQDIYRISPRSKGQSRLRRSR
ncbi:MAG TPA: peptide ABC transporter substrate-binding protein [Candidatus Limnocylindrales bacterium]|nr:peptide ABC transporter substrate-binding protein [Candidatus Limnocylindrales bacterium]